MQGIRQFSTYRTSTPLLNVFENIEYIHNDTSSFIKAITSCISYFSEETFIPDSLILSIYNNLHDKILEIVHSNIILGYKINQIIGKIIYIHTYQISSNSSTLFFIDQLHLLSEHIESLLK